MLSITVKLIVYVLSMNFSVAPGRNFWSLDIISDKSSGYDEHMNALKYIHFSEISEHVNKVETLTRKI